jgi:hypothetical protein
MESVLLLKAVYFEIVLRALQHKSHVHGLSPTASCILALGINKDFLKKDKPTKRALVLSKV